MWPGMLGPDGARPGRQGEARQGAAGGVRQGAVWWVWPGIVWQARHGKARHGRFWRG